MIHNKCKKKKKKFTCHVIFRHVGRLENDNNMNGKHLVELLNLKNSPEKSVLSAFRSGKYWSRALPDLNNVCLEHVMPLDTVKDKGFDLIMCVQQDRGLGQLCSINYNKSQA